MIGMILFAALAAATPAKSGCAGHWAVELDRDSFANNGAGRTFSAARLAAFRTQLEVRIKSAIGGACKAGKVRPALAKSIRRVKVFSASGASEPHLYRHPGGGLALEWVFAEENLALPPAKDIVAGTACWTDPNGAACAAEGD